MHVFVLARFLLVATPCFALFGAARPGEGDAVQAGEPVAADVAEASVARTAATDVVPADLARPAAASPADVAPALVTWRELCARPGRSLGRRVRLEVQFHARIAAWNPYLSRFGPRDHRAIGAWADEQFAWRVGDYESPAVRFFVRAESAADFAFDSARTFGRFEVTGVVREIFRGEPWIEVDAATPLSEQVTEGTVIHAARAIELANEEQWELAEAELVRALASPLPAKARVELERICAIVRASRDAQR